MGEIVTTRIDHAAEADICINSAHKNGEDYFLIQQAQVHATLALVEQQRIANLIALFTIDTKDAADFATVGFSYPAALVDITEGLGPS